MTYKTKGSACPKTCKYPEGNPSCPTKIVEGCQCPNHEVQSIDVDGNVICINPKECEVCTVDGQIYTEGQKIRKDCQEW